MTSRVSSKNKEKRSKGKIVLKSWWSCIYHEFKYAFEENQLKRVFQSYFALFRVQRADSMWIIDRTSFTEFGGAFGDQQRLTLERNDMKLGPFN